MIFLNLEGIVSKRKFATSWAAQGHASSGSLKHHCAASSETHALETRLHPLVGIPHVARYHLG